MLRGRKVTGRLMLSAGLILLSVLGGCLGYNHAFCDRARYIPLTDDDKSLINTLTLSKAAGDAVLYHDEAYRKDCM
jgi:hypothetical protein